MDFQKVKIMPNLNFAKFTLFFTLVIVLFSANTFGQAAKITQCIEIEEDYAAQIAEATRGIKFSAYNLQAYLKRGYAYIMAGKYDEALKDFNRAIEINPKSDEAFFLRGNLYATRANYDKAIRDFSTAIELNSENASFYYERARSYSSKDELILLLDDSNTAIRLNPELAQAYYQRGVGSYMLREKEKALKDWKKVVELATREIETISNNECQYDNYLLRAIVYKATGNFSQAVMDYNAAIKLSPNFYQTYYYRGRLYFDNHDYWIAINNLTKAIELNPDFAESYQKRAAAYDKVREKEKAESDRKKYQELSEKP